jgi:hypothetical protein
MWRPGCRPSILLLRSSRRGFASALCRVLESHWGGDLDRNWLGLRRKAAPIHVGPANFGTIYALVGIAFTSGIVVGPLVAAQAHDRFGTYTPAVSGLAVAALAAGVLMAVGVRSAKARLENRRHLYQERVLEL